MTKRPAFDAAWTRFAEVNIPVADVGAKIGGKVGVNVASGEFANACPIRMSYVLNHGGIAIPGPTGSPYSVVSGADHKWYMFRVRDMMDFLEERFHVADRTVKLPKRKDFAGVKGVMTIIGHGWQDARGHVSLWDGAAFADANHLTDSTENGPFVPEIAKLWKLP